MKIWHYKLEWVCNLQVLIFHSVIQVLMRVHHTSPGRCQIIHNDIVWCQRVISDKWSSPVFTGVRSQTWAISWTEMTSQSWRGPFMQHRSDKVLHNSYNKRPNLSQVTFIYIVLLTVSLTVLIVSKQLNCVRVRACVLDFFLNTFILIWKILHWC